MGNFLEAPITDKTTEVGEDEGKRAWVGMSCMQGWRAQMEDDHLISLSLPEAEGISLFGVFDGHGGDHVAHYTAKHVQRHILATKGLSPPFSVSAVSAAFTRAIIGLDAELRQQPEHVSGHDQSGTTLTMVALTPTDIICANTGDSRSVLSRAGAAIDLSNDHKPFLEEEKTRIERAGGHVKFNRVNGDLAVSRALGDFAYKQRDDLPAEAQAVTAAPEVMSQSRHADDEFVILACDGIWDVMSSQECVNFVSDLLHSAERPPLEPRAAAAGEHEQGAGRQREAWDLGAVCEVLLDKCLDKGSRDNMSVVLVSLKPELAPGTAARRKAGPSVSAAPERRGAEAVAQQAAPPSPAAPSPVHGGAPSPKPPTPAA